MQKCCWLFVTKILVIKTYVFNQELAKMICVTLVKDRSFIKQKQCSDDRTVGIALFN